MSTIKSNSLSVSHKDYKPQLSWLSVAISTILMAGGTATSFAQENTSFARKARVIKANEIGVQSLGSLAYSSEMDTFFVGQVQSVNDTETNYPVQKVSAFGDNVGTLSVSTSISDPINTVFDGTRGQLLFLNSEFSDKLIAVDTNNGNTTQFDFKSLGLNNPQGLALDSTTGALYILDADDQQILVVKPSADQDFSNTTVTRIDLTVNGLRGIALNPTNGHLYVLNPDAHELYQLTPQGDQVMTHDLSGFMLSDSQGIVFAPSGDQTDNSAEMSLYIANTGLAKEAIPSESDGLVSAGVVEFSLSPVFQSNSADIFTSSAPTTVATLISTIDTSSLATPSHDPSGITYLETPNTLLICDGEAEEAPFLAANNLFELSVDGSFVDTSSILSFTKEPTGASTLHPTTQHIFFTDDDANRIFELGAGSDKQFGTADDGTASFIKTIDLFTPAGGDPEGVALAPGLGATGALFTVDGDNREVYRLDLVNNGLAGSTMTSHFDTEILGIPDPEGIEYHTPTGHLFVLGMQTIAGTISKKAVLFEMTTDGTVLQEIDISAAPIKKAAGLALAPSSVDASKTTLYIADRGKDPGINGDNIQDGKVFEISFTPTAPTNTAPYINAGEDKTIILPATASLSGAVNDDGIPASTTVMWTKVSGSGSVAFTNGNSVATTATFSEAGTYVLKLTANDTVLSSFDEVTVEVSPVGTSTFLDVRIAASSDDAEEHKDTGIMEVDGNDLDISDRHVGLRFSSVSIPAGSTIKKAYVQFTAHNISVDKAFAARIEGQAIDNAPTFIFGESNNISNRVKTTAQVAWNGTTDAADAWVAGEAGSNQQTPDLTAIIQEIVDHSEWASNNSLALILTDAGSSKREAKSYDTDFDHATAPLLHIEFVAGGGGGGGNQAPTANAGADQSITFGSDATLNGTVSDDGKPTTLTTSWTKVSGPDGGDVTFADASAVDTTASFSKVGTYVLKLTADDSELKTADEISITVGGDVTKDDQVITGFSSTLTTGVAGDTATLSVTDSGASENAVIFTSSTPSICIVNGATLNLLAVGTCTVTANQAGNDSYNAAIQQSINITVGKADQEILGFATTAGDSVFVGENATLSFTGSGGSGEIVFYQSKSLGVCTISQSTVNFIGVGVCKLVADQHGNANYNAAPQVALGKDITVTQAIQELSGFKSNPVPTTVGKSTGLTVATKGASSQPVVFASTTSEICTVDGATVSFIATGSCQLTADQAGDANYAASTQLTLTLNISKGSQTISGFSIAPTPESVGDTAKLTITGSGGSGNSVDFTSSTLDICTLESDLLTIIRKGSCTITADQAGNDNYNAAAQVSKIINIENGAALLGDSTGDSSVDILDIVETINRVLKSQSPVNGADCNEDGTLNVLDIVCTINIVLNAQ